ncbi:MAG TPA: DNA repair protein RecN [Chitinophagaceae bacterium]|nr:DNA repair protein RecN [Chitinophagaceae bacterium]
MLSRLYISNYAIISEVEISFTKGLNIITGETGAGKSILIGALGLILGERADSSVLLDKTRKCLVEGVFPQQQKESIQQFFIDNDIDNEGEIILRREIAVNGKSRAFINDTPVNLSQLQLLASQLVDLHQQFDTLELGQDTFQMEILDALATQFPLRSDFAKAFQSYVVARSNLRSLESAREESLKEYDYYQYLHNELEEAAFKPGELEQLESELNLLAHAEQVNNTLQKVGAVLDTDELPVTQQLKSLIQSVEAVARYHPTIQSISDRLRSVQIELKDISSEADHMAAGISMDAARLSVINERLSTGYKLLKKHNVTDTDGLLKVQEQIAERISRVLNLDNDINKAKQETAKLEKQALDLALKLSKGRKAVVSGFEANVKALLKRVGMPNAFLKVSLQTNELNAAGIDQVEFLFDANKSGRYEPLRKVASGGEFSRLLLCIKTLVAGSLAMPLMIFDEIDTGISGEAAKQVGILMKEMGGSHQVISITHQPQIAARADAHYFVYKKEQNGAIRTQLRRLNDDERVESIAKMMSGEKPSTAAMESAKELMNAGE